MKKVKAPIVDLNVKVPDSYGTTREPLGVCLINKKRGRTGGNGSWHDFEANFRHVGCNTCETVSPIDNGVSLRDDFFDNRESCSTKPANLDELVFLYFIISPLVLFLWI